MMDICCKMCNLEKLNISIYLDNKRQIFVDELGCKLYGRTNMSLRTCQICGIEKQRNFVTININKRFVFIDDYNKVWHGKQCGSCFSHKVNIKQKTKRSYTKETRREYEKNYRVVNLNYKLSCSLRSRLSIGLRKYIKEKIGSAVKDLGCSLPELIVYLENQFTEGMSWENYGKGLGKWSIDHIYPLSKADLSNREEFLKVNNYKNLQPMWDQDNKKKSNKII